MENIGWQHCVLFVAKLCTFLLQNTRLDKVPVKACSWAVFPNQGPFPSTLQETMAKTYSEWLPTSDYEVINAPSFSFTKMDENKKDYAYSEIWLPVRKNK